MSTFKISGSMERAGAAIRSARILRRLTQQELADAVGLSRPTVVAAEAGRSISSQNLFSLFDHLAIGLSVIAAQPVVRQASAASGHQAGVRPRPKIGDLMAAERRRRAAAATAAF